VSLAAHAFIKLAGCLPARKCVLTSLSPSFTRLVSMTAGIERLSSRRA
jgi:hypothetical protein